MDGTYLRVWTNRDGVEVQRMCVVRGDVVTDLRKAKTYPLSRWDAMAGRWVHVSDDTKRASMTLVGKAL